MDELQKYYEYLRSAGADVPDTFESFKSTLQDSASAKQYYDYLKTNGFDAPDTYDSFANTLGLKKKVGSTAFPEYESETPSTSSSDILKLVSEHKKISGRVSEVSKPVYTPGGGALISKPAESDVARLPEIEAQIKAAGFDSKEILQEFSNFPETPNVDIGAMLQEKKENPLSFERHKAAYQWQVPLFNAIRSKDPNGEAVIQGLISGQQGGAYDDKRNQTKAAIDAARMYVNDKDEQDKIIQQISRDKAFTYGLAGEDQWQSIQNDNRYIGKGGSLNNYQVMGMHFMEDTDPEKAKLYSNYIEAKPQGLWGEEDIVRGYEKKLKNLEDLGMQLQAKSLEEKMTGLIAKKEKNELTEQDALEYTKLYDQYSTLQEDTGNQPQRYPQTAAMEADRLLQEATGQRNSPLKLFALKWGENTGDKIDWLHDIVMSPFRDEQEKTIDDLEELGEHEFRSKIQTYIPEYNQLVQNDGKVNITPKAIFNTMATVGGEIISNIDATAMVGAVGKVGKFTSLFGTTYANAYNDYYNEAISKDIQNPQKYATVHTAIEAASELINPDLPALKKIIQPSTTFGQIVNNITQAEWDDVLKNPKGKFRSLFEAVKTTGETAAKNSFQETFEELAGQLAGNVADITVFNQDEDLMEGMKSSFVNTIVGTLPLGFLGLPGQVAQLNRQQQYALYEVAQNKEKYLPQLEADVKNGVISEEKATQVRHIIDNMSSRLDELSEKNTINKDLSDNEKVEVLTESVKEDPSKQKAIETLQTAVEIGKLKGQYAELAKDQPEEVLKDIAKQAQNLDDNFIPHNDGREDDARQATEETFGNKLVEAAVSLYPPKQPPAPMTNQEGVRESASPSISEEGVVAGDSGEVVPPTPTSSGVIFSERPGTELSFRGLQNVANEFGYEDVRSRDTVSDIQERQNARQTADEWKAQGVYERNIQDLLTKINAREMVPTAKQRLILQQYLTNKAQQLRETTRGTQEYTDRLADVERIKQIGQIARQEAGAALRIPEGGQSHPVADFGDAIVAMADAIGTTDLTEDQQKEVDDLVKNYEQKDKDAQAKIVELEAKLSEMEASKEVKQEAGKKKGVRKKTAEQYKDEREKLREELKAAKKEHDDWMKSQGIQSMGVSFSMTPKMVKVIGKIAGSYVDELGDNIAEITNRVLSEIQEFFPDATEKDVHDVISGAWDKEIERIEAATKRNEKAAADLKDKTANKDFEKQPPKRSVFDNPELKKKFPELYKQALDALTAREDAKRDFDVALAKAELAKRSKTKKLFDIGKGIVATSKAIASGIDFSAIFMQNLVAMAAHPRSAIKALPASFVDAAKEKTFTRWLTELHNSSNWDLIEKSGLNITDPKSLREEGKEEAFVGNLLDKKLKIKGKTYQISKIMTKPFERQFTSLGNRMRVNMFLRAAERWQKDKDNPKTFETHPELYKSLARMLNTETGRGGVPDNVKKGMENITPIIWSPRLIASRLNLLGLSDLAFLTGKKGYYAGLDPEVRKMAIGDLAKFIGFGVAVLLVAGNMGGDVDDDPESPTFGTFKFGNKNYNVWGGFTPYVKTIWQSISGKRKAGDKEKNTTSGELALKYFRSRLTPFAGTVTNLMMGKDYSGKQVTFEDAVKSSFMPISVKGITEGLEKDGVAGIMTQGIPSIVGIGVSDERDFARKPNLTIYEKGKKRTATIEEEEKYNKLRDSLKEKKLASIIDKGAYIDKYGDVTLDKSKRKKTVKYDTLDEDKIKDLNESISRQATYEAKKQLKWDKKP